MYSFLYSRLWRMYSPWIYTDQRAMRNISNASTTIQKKYSVGDVRNEDITQTLKINPIVIQMMRSRVHFSDI